MGEGWTGAVIKGSHNARPVPRSFFFNPGTGKNAGREGHERGVSGKAVKERSGDKKGIEEAGKTFVHVPPDRRPLEV